MYDGKVSRVWIVKVVGMVGIYTHHDLAGGFRSGGMKRVEQTRGWWRRAYPF